MRKIRYLVPLAAAGLALTVAVGTASASTAGPGFAAQAREYGLRSAQISKLQREVANYIARHGGKQIAINEVASTGSRTIFPVPGEKYSRPVISAATAHPSIAADCPYQFFCMYQDENYGGAQQDFTVCHDIVPNSDGYKGSWKNDQTPGVYGDLYVSNPTKPPKAIQFCPAWCANSDWEQSTVDVDACVN